MGFAETTEDLVEILKCGDSIISILPTIMFLAASTTCYVIFFNRGRRFNRRVLYKILFADLQELLLATLISHTFRVWRWIVYFLDVILVEYWKTMQMWFPTQTELANENRGFLVYMLLRPKELKILLCTAIAYLPVMYLLNQYESVVSEHDFIVWINPMRWERTELGSAMYFLDRPSPQRRSDSSMTATRTRSAAHFRSRVEVFRSSRSTC